MVKSSSVNPWLIGTAAVGGVLYAAMWLGWTLGWAWLAAVDSAALDPAHRIGVEHIAWVTFWNALCNVLSPVTFRLLTLALIVYEIVRGRRRTALFLFVSIELSAVVTQLAKWLADRPRPATAMLDAASTSFPSGHALGCMVAVLALWVVLLPRVRPSLWPAAIVMGVLVVVSVGVGRVALNVHYPSDVVAGWSLGYLYFVACLPLLRRQPVTAADETPVAPGRPPSS